MEFGFTGEQEALRAEVRDWMNENIPPRWAELDPDMWEEDDETWAIAHEFERRLADRGWHAPGYPSKYGGLDASLMEQAIIKEEKAYNGAPTTGSDYLAADWIGSTILMYGTEEQKDEYVGGIGRGELIFCAGYSEPNAGSDLAGLQTRAVRDGDDYVINGQKIYTSIAHRSDYVWMAVRTDPDAPKHKGITMFVADMKSPGISVRPLINILGSHHFNEVFFEDVRVPAANIVGGVNQGWYALMTALNYERSGIFQSALARREIERLVRYVKETQWRNGVLADNPLVRRKLAELAVENDVARMLCYRAISMQAQGEMTTFETSMSFLVGSEHIRHLANAAIDMLGPYGLLRGSSERAPLRGRAYTMYLGTLPYGIGAGTLEVQRGIIATLGLGLPRR